MPPIIASAACLTSSAAAPSPARENSLVQKGAWAAGASACNLFGRLAVQVVLARMLGSEGLGQVVYLLWIIEIGNLLASFGLQGSLTRFSAELLGRRQPEHAVAFAQWIYTRYLAIAILGASILGVLFYHSRHYAGAEAVLPILVALFLLRSLESINLAYLAGRQRFDLLARIYLASSVIQLAGVLIGVHFYGTIGALLGSIAGALAPAACSASMLRGFSFRTRIDPGLRRRAWKFALNTWLALLVSAVIWSRTEIFFLERYWGASEVAMFTVGLTLAAIVQQVAQLFSGAFLPHFAGLVGAGERAVMQRQYQMATKLMALLVIPLSFGGAAISPVLVPLLFGTAFASAAPNAMVLMIAAALSFSLIGSALVYALERSDFIALGGGAGAVLFLAAAVLIIPRYGVWGAVWTRLLVQSSMISLATWFITCRLHFSFPFSALGRMIMAGLLCGVVARCVIQAIPHPLLAIGVAVPLGAVVYIVGIRAFHALGADEAFQLSRLANGLPADLRRRLQSLVQWMAFAS